MLNASHNHEGFAWVRFLTLAGLLIIIAALAFPTCCDRGRYHEPDERIHCFDKLFQIAMAVKQYRLDEAEYPANILDIASYISLRTSVSGGKAQATGGKIVLICPEDQAGRDRSYTTNSLPYSSYYDTADRQLVWNYWGYQSDGFAYTKDDSEFKKSMRKAGIAGRKFPRLANRTAPENTIITHCVHQRRKTGGDPEQQLDIVVRLSGAAQTVRWKTYDWVTQPEEP